jgi:tRNA(fMet)-specific endonuclease VapC
LTPSRIVLDTSAYARLRAGHAGVLQILTEVETVYLPAIVLGELEAGFRRGRRTKENHAMLAEFLQESFTTVLPVTEDVARVYGRLFASLREAGTPIPVNDIWIAASTVEAGAHLVTFDRGFDLVRELDRTVLEA